MARYYCPFCPNSPQINHQGSGRVILCKYCGDELVKIHTFSAKQILALITCTAFLSPLMIMILEFVKPRNIIKPNKDFSLQAEVFIKVND